MLVLLILNFLVKLGWITLPDALTREIAKAKRMKLVRPNFIAPIIIGLAAIFFSFTTKTEDNLPAPKGIVNQLFYLQRDPDANTVVYKLNTINGMLNDKEPVSVFWIRYAEGGKIKQLSSIQRNLAYGLKSKKIDKDKHELSFVSYPELKLLLTKSANDNQYYVYTSIEKQQIILDRIFVRTSKSGIGWPDVVYIELNGRTIENGKSIRHRIYV